MSEQDSMVGRVKAALRAEVERQDTAQPYAALLEMLEIEPLARAAISALREPTEAMTRQFIGPAKGAYGDVEAADTWRKMIDACLQE